MTATAWLTRLAFPSLLYAFMTQAAAAEPYQTPLLDEDEVFMGQSLTINPGLTYYSGRFNVIQIECDRRPEERHHTVRLIHAPRTQEEVSGYEHKDIGWGSAGQWYDTSRPYGFGGGSAQPPARPDPDNVVTFAQLLDHWMDPANLPAKDSGHHLYAVAPDGKLFPIQKTGDARDLKHLYERGAWDIGGESLNAYQQPLNRADFERHGKKQCAPGL